MPTYVYRCSAGHEYEVQQGIHDEPYRHCGTLTCTHVDRDAREVTYLTCSAPLERVPQAGFFKITGGGVHSPGFH